MPFIRWHPDRMASGAWSEMNGLSQASLLFGIGGLVAAVVTTDGGLALLSMVFIGTGLADFLYSSWWVRSHPKLVGDVQVRSGPPAPVPRALERGLACVALAAFAVAFYLIRRFAW